MSKLRGFKFVATLVLVFKKIESEDKTKFDNFYSSSKAEIMINEIDVDDVFNERFRLMMTMKGSGWIIDSFIDHTISISKYNPLA